MNRRATALRGTSDFMALSLVGRLLRVVKLPLSSAVAASALYGFVLANGRFDERAAVVFIAIVMLSGGAAALNNCQDHAYDRLFRRTRERPVASGELSMRTALATAVFLFVTGSILLVMASGTIVPWLVAMLVVMVYNGVYTYLKPKTGWALLPGAICGALPPLIGWLAGGGRQDPIVLLLFMALMAVWQGPHFWLVLLDHRNDYRAAPHPSLADAVSLPALHMLTFIGLAVFVCVVHAFLLADRSAPSWLDLVNSIGALILLATFAHELFLRQVPRYRVLFHMHNGYLLVLMTLSMVGNLFFWQA